MPRLPVSREDPTHRVPINDTNPVTEPGVSTAPIELATQSRSHHEESSNDQLDPIIAADNATNLEHPNDPTNETPRLNESWGDDIFQTKPQNSCRIYFQNVHGLRPTQRIEAKWVDCLQVVLRRRHLRLHGDMSQLVESTSCEEIQTGCKAMLQSSIHDSFP